tara:strand:- start:131 stop:469 length:339 start_codon:yes stop_codon:yes gene_type:complete
MLVATGMNSIQNIQNANKELSSEQIIEQIPPSQLQTLALFSTSLMETNIPAHEAVITLANELRSPESFQKFILKMSSIIQKETKIMELAEIMARNCRFESENIKQLKREEIA